MKELEILMKTFGEGLRTLAQGVNAIADKLDGYVEASEDDSDSGLASEPTSDESTSSKNEEESPEPAVNATEVVYETIVAADGSVSMDELCEKTGYDRKKLSNILYRLRKQDKIENVSKGVYVVKNG